MSKLAKRLGMEHKGPALAPRSWPSLLGPRFREDIEQRFAGMWRPWWPAFLEGPEPSEVPAVDVFEEGDAVVLKAELPGLKKEEIEVEVIGDVVTIYRGVQPLRDAAGRGGGEQGDGAAQGWRAGGESAEEGGAQPKAKKVAIV